MEYLDRICEITGMNLEDLNRDAVISAESHFSIHELEEVWLEYYEYKLSKLLPAVPLNLAQATAYFWYETNIPGKIFQKKDHFFPVLYEATNLYHNVLIYYTSVLYNAQKETIILSDLSGEVEFSVPMREIIENLENKNRQYFHNMILDHLDENGALT